MTRRRIISFTLSCMLTAPVGISAANRPEQNTAAKSQSRESAGIKVIINQMPAKDGVIPVEIIQPTIASSTPNTLDDLTYTFRDNSGKALIAAAVVRTITYEERGKVYSHSVYSTIDAAFHPDQTGKAVHPGAQMSMESAGPVGFDEGVIIKEITLTLEYVSYDDRTAYGSGGEGERTINAIREGARLYKRWLVQEYSRAGKSLATIFPLMQAPGVPETLQLKLEQVLGADRYRLNLLRILKTKGAAEVESYLTRNQ